MDVLLIGFENSKHQTFIKNLEDFLNTFKKQLNIHQLASPAGLPDWMAKNTNPHLIFFWRPCISDLNYFRKITRSLRALDRGSCIFITHDDMPSSIEVMEFLDAGATGIIQLNFSLPQARETLVEAIEKRLLKHQVRHRRIEASQNVSLKIANLQQGIVAETFNIGVGGMFIRINPRDLKVGDIVTFDLLGSKTLTSKFDNEDDQKLLHGTARVVWIRAQAQGPLPEGVGLQFIDLDEASQKRLDEWVGLLRAKAFVPKA